MSPFNLKTFLAAFSVDKVCHKRGRLLAGKMNVKIWCELIQVMNILWSNLCVCTHAHHWLTHSCVIIVCNNPWFHLKLSSVSVEENVVWLRVVFSLICTIVNKLTLWFPTALTQRAVFDVWLHLTRCFIIEIIFTRVFSCSREDGKRQLES